VFGDLTGVSLVVAASTSLTDAQQTAWLSSGDPAAVISDVTPSTWRGNLWSVISSVGNLPGIYLPTLSFPYSLSPGNVASYDHIVSSGGLNTFNIPQLGGNSSFTVEQVIPGLFGFWAIQPHSNPQPSATQLGSFYIDASGNLTFIVGPPEPVVTGVTRAGNVNTVTFTTLAIGSYSLAYSPTLGSPISTWSVVSGPVSGNGSSQSLSHTTAGSGGFSGVVFPP
jgi:hypothetical protein